MRGNRSSGGVIQSLEQMHVSGEEVEKETEEEVLNVLTVWGEG